MRIHVDHACRASPAGRLDALSASVDCLLAAWHGPDAERFQELWGAWHRAARAACIFVAPRASGTVPRQRSHRQAEPVPVAFTAAELLAQLHAWQRDLADLARELEGKGEVHSGDWRAAQAELVALLAQLRGVAAQAG